MSDLVALGDLLDGMVGDDPGFDEIQWAVEEIERLQFLLKETLDQLSYDQEEMRGLRLRLEAKNE